VRDTDTMWYSVAEAEQSTMQLVIDQLEELVVTVIEEVRQRPAIAVAILAAVVGALIGTLLATGVGRKQPVGKRVSKRVSKGMSKGLGSMGDMAELAGLGMRLLENPIVREYARAAVVGQLKKRVMR